TRCAVYWYWMSDNISVEGVQHDLEAMKRAGITRAFIGNIWQDEVKAGDIKVLSPGWWEVMHAALKRASELDIEIGVFNCPGWSQSGGPWVKPTQAMRFLDHSEVTVEGTGTMQTVQLPSMGNEATDVRVLAYPLFAKTATVTATIDKQAGHDATADIPLGQKMTVRNITFSTDRYLLVDVKIYAKQGDDYRLLKVVHLDRTNTALNTGLHPYAPISINLPDTETDVLRLECCGGPQDCHFTATVTDQSRVERYEEKSLCKMFQSPLPMWGEYMWETQPEATGYRYVQPDEVLDLTQAMKADGTLAYAFPMGRWQVIRTAMRPTGVTNGPASREATGYEVDKMSREHVAAHFDAYLGELLRRIPAEDRTTFKVVVEDSYETGGQNWTDDFVESFRKTYDYDPVPFIPTLYGQVIGSQDQTERFLWDVRRLVADRVAYDYVGGLRDVSHEHNLTTWLECYGHWGFPSEFLMYGGQSDEVAGEFWSEGSLGDIENRAASSCAHIYGKQKVWAESCTAGGPNYSRYPAVMKGRTDRFFCEGINATLLHLFIQQPDDTTLPGISAPFGNDFQRKNTWFSQMDLFTDYLRRCNYLLQQGRYVADVAYFIGEDAPKMTGACDPALPSGYSFDYINAEVLKKSTVKDGRLCLPSGMSYSVLVLPNQRTMRPEILRRLYQFVGQGLHVVGPRPEVSPSMKDYPKADIKVRQLGAMMWTKEPYGKGHVYDSGTDLQTVLDALGVIPDCFVPSGLPFAFIHRTLGDKEIYFISNQSGEPHQFPITFRTTGMKPQWWNPVTADQFVLTDYTDNGVTTSATIPLAANESAFIVFSTETADLPAPLAAEPTVLQTVETPWTVTFQTSMRGPKDKQTFTTLTPWNENVNPEIRYYSGTATYINTLKLKQKPTKETYLDLGRVMVMARVYVNDQLVGGVWTAPYRVNVTRFLKKGTNHLRVEVVNNWQNRLIGDQQLPVAERPTWTSVNPWNADSPLQESGLLGPVRLVQ
ncbi:MAG: glycoside hydrolase family 2, partial [Bacteroidaceae bacterium]|nr:glycoside hydrolase family 2 [Bacteroidaceae bacterium]